MKLKLFNEVNLPKMTGAVHTIPRVSFTKSGVIRFNGPALKLCSLKAGDKISMARDDEQPENWYFYISKDGFTLKPNTKQNGLQMHHTALVAAFIADHALNKSITHSVIIAGQPTLITGEKTKLWGLIV